MKVGLVTLGCDKNTVDSERYLARLAGHGAEETSDLAEAELIIVNTCGFIDAAKKESIDAIIGAGHYKSSGSCRAVVAVGCMVERHKQELADALPEVDLFLGASEVDDLAPQLEALGILGPEDLAAHPGVRVYSGHLPHVRYLKISEGCDHGCAFCAIPLMRGRHRSFALEDVVHEAQLLELQGARELNLVAQDLAHWGRDLRAGTSLPDLLEALVAETGVPWFRLLYLYSSGITERLIDVIARHPRILGYLDMPIQHASDQVLQRMRRPERAATIRERVARFRAAVPDVAIRTTCIVGFPGETDDDFQRLLDFLAEVQFERVGAFTYSPQEGTRAAELNDDVPDSVKRDRLEQLNDMQSRITSERYESRLGRTAIALVDRIDPLGITSSARLPWQADDIDGTTRIDAAVSAGSFVEVAVDEVVDDVDFTASFIRVIDPVAAPAPLTRRERRLPLVSTVGSFGR